jgi:hypothetical protein
MNKTILTIIILIIFKTVSCQDVFRFAIKSGHVKYRLTGNNIGYEEIYWDDYGAKYYTEENYKEISEEYGFLKEKKEHSIFIFKGAEVINVDMISKTGTISNKGSYKTEENRKRQLTEQEQEEMSEKIIRSLNLEVVGKKKILGRECTVLNGVYSKYWIYKGVPLKTETTFDNFIVDSKAKIFQENIDIPPERFEPPPGVRITDVTEQENALLGAVVAVMEKPDPEQGRQLLVEQHAVIPVSLSYSYESFEKAIHKFDPKEYTLRLIKNEDENYTAVYEGEQNDFLNVICTSSSNIDIYKEKYAAFEKIENDETPMLFGTLEEGGVTKNLLLMEFEANHIYIILEVPSEVGLSTLLELSELIEITEK